MTMPLVFYDSRNRIEGWAHRVLELAARSGEVWLMGPQALRLSLGRETLRSINFVELEQLEGYKQDSAEFKSAYRHMSTAPYDYEFACFDRFIALNRLMESMSWESSWHIDTDAVVASPLPAFDDVDAITLAWNTDERTGDLPAASAGNALLTGQAVRCFVEFIISEMYVGENLEYLWHRYAERMSENLFGGVCDMTAWGMLRHRNQLGDVINLSNTLIRGSVWINSTYSVQSQVKQMQWDPGIKDRQIVLDPKDRSLKSESHSLPLLGVHFAGADKLLIHDWHNEKKITIGGPRHYILRSAYRVRRKSISIASTCRNSKACD